MDRCVQRNSSAAQLDEWAITLPPSPELKRRASPSPSPVTVTPDTNSPVTVNKRRPPSATGDRTPLLTGHSSEGGSSSSYTSGPLATACATVLGLLMLIMYFLHSSSGSSGAPAALASLAAAPGEVRLSVPPSVVPPPATSSDVKLTLEAALDVDGDIQLWRRAVHVRVRGAAAVAWWRDAFDRGCSGELFGREVGFVQGRLACPGGRQSPRLAERGAGSAATDLGRGKVWWAPAGAGDGGVAEFRIGTGASSSAAREAPLNGGGEEAARAVFGEVEAGDAASWEALDAVQALQTKPSEGRGTSAVQLLDPPLRITLERYG